MHRTANTAIVTLSLACWTPMWGLSTPLARDVRPLHFAVAAMVSPAETFSIYVDLTRYLSQKLQREIVLKQRRTYHEVNQMLDSGEIDFAWLCTGGFIEARREFGATALVTPVVGGVPLYHAFVIVARDSSIGTFDELRGRTFAFTDPYSHTGRIYPSYLVLRLGESVDNFFGKTFYTYSHDRAIEAVAQGLADGASVDHLVYEYLMATKPNLIRGIRILHVSEPFGAPPIVTSSTIQPELKKRIQDALLQMGEEPDGRAILNRLHVDGFVIPPSDLYDDSQRVWEATRGLKPEPQ